jgi:uncharacterized protein (DUF1810 family)
MTLFARASDREDTEFATALQKFFHGTEDPATMNRLR